ncbi:BolA family protein [Rivibacter subsaxonicus]|uniref:BolA protein family transcriptional regulator n=1 Tax=Rivibacter subsaxonicus TaxID=457575 RepID=A0A4Q7V7V8_9BURK|nr:BolA protein family transcriptional regulator [Rivibacter subsaxonicus]
MSAQPAFPSAAEVEAALRSAFPDAIELVVRDDSHQHAGHAGAASGRHFFAQIVSERFSASPRVARHRLVYDALGPWMHRGIHALALQTLTPAEAAAAANGPR